MSNKTKASKTIISPNPASIDKHPTVVAISPYTEGFGYTVFKSPQNLIDWGVTKLHCNKLNRVLNRFEMLRQRYRPNAIAVQIPCKDDKHKSLAAKMIYAFSKLSAVQSTPFMRFHRKDIVQLFTQFDATTKEQIADKIVEFLPELKPYRPEHRAIWEREHTNMKIFDAASLALTFYSTIEDEMNEKHKSKK